MAHTLKMISTFALLGALSSFMIATPPDAFAQGKEEAKEEEKKEKKPEPRWSAYEEFAKGNKLVSYGGYARAIKHYKRALAVDPDNYTIAHFNLGEIYAAKENCADAIFHYQIYVRTGRDEEAVTFAKQGVTKCKKLNPEWATLSLKTKRKYPKKGEEGLAASIVLRGNILSDDGTLEGFILPPKMPSDKENFEIERRAEAGMSSQKGSEMTEYEVTVHANDFTPQTFGLTAAPGSNPSREVTLEMMTFYGAIAVDVSEDGARVKISPKAVDKPTEQPETISITSPSEKAHKLPTGKYLVEVEREGYDRWIRHVYVTRDNTSKVQISLTKSLPPEIR